MNIFEKLNAARLRFQNAGVKMSGRNAFANYSYFELSDILPVVNKAAVELGFSCVVRFGKEEATLDFIDIEKPGEKITFTSPMSSAQLKGCHEVQNLGAVESYVRRYLYLTAFEIVESDCLDATSQSLQAGQPTAPNNNIGKNSNGQSPAQQTPARKPSGRQASAKAAPSENEMMAEMQRIFEQSTYPDGSPVFNEHDKAFYRAKVTKERTCKAGLDMLKEELAARLNEN